MSGKYNILAFKLFFLYTSIIIIIRILLSEKDDSSIKIADFLFANLIDELDAKETACGKPVYVEPGKLT
jgi:hypothetical protein